MFDFGFEIRIKTILPLINRLINEVLLVDNRFSTRCCFRSWTSLAGFSDKHVPACWFQLVGVSKSWCTGVVFMQPGVKVNGAHYCDVLLLATFVSQKLSAFAHACCAGKPRLRTLHQTWPFNRPYLSSVDHWDSFRNVFIRNSKGRQTSLMSCIWLLTEWHYH